MGTILGIKAPEHYPAGDFFTLLSSKLSVGGYPCNNITIWEPVQARFNKHHLKARCIIEVLFGSMKAQSVAIFLQNPGTQSTVCPKGLTSCAKLHNIWEWGIL